MQEFYSTIEAAKLLSVSVRTVQLWVENGSLDAWKTAGGHRRITAKSVNQLLNKQDRPKVPSNNKKLLIVEDNPTVLKFYEAVINSWGMPIEIITAVDGFTGLVAIGKHAPDMLITDIYMPGMDGLQMIHSLYKSEQITAEQIIIISGLSNDSIQERGGVPNGVIFFSKPVDVELLKERLMTGLRLQQLADAE